MTPYLVMIHDGSHFPGKHFREVRFLLSTLVKKKQIQGTRGPRLHGWFLSHHMIHLEGFGGVVILRDHMAWFAM